MCIYIPIYMNTYNFQLSCNVWLILLFLVNRVQLMNVTKIRKVRNLGGKIGKKVR